MGVERNHKLGRRHLPPNPEIDMIAADHPPQIQVEAFAGAAPRGSRKEISNTPSATLR
jgi:hypothetical protein